LTSTSPITVEQKGTTLDQLTSGTFNIMLPGWLDEKNIVKISIDIYSERIYSNPTGKIDYLKIVPEGTGGSTGSTFTSTCTNLTKNCQFSESLDSNEYNGAVMSFDYLGEKDML